MSTRFIAWLAAALVPTALGTATAQPEGDPIPPETAPPPPESDPTTQPAPTPAPPPVVIVNPPPAEQKTYTTEIPRYETYYESWNRPMFTTGAILFLGSYGAALVVAGTSEDDAIDRGNDQLYIPIAGPWMALNDRPDCDALNDCDNEEWKKGLLIADGVVQAVGAGTMIAGLLQPRETRVLTNPVASRSFRVTPTASLGRGTGPGLVVAGRF